MGFMRNFIYIYRMFQECVIGGIFGGIYRGNFSTVKELIGGQMDVNSYFPHNFINGQAVSVYWDTQLQPRP